MSTVASEVLISSREHLNALIEHGFNQVPLHAREPPCRGVANIVGVKLVKQYLNLFQREHFSDNSETVNPLHKEPYIIDDDLKLGESRAGIMAYLVNKYKPNDEHLYPGRNIKLRARIDELLHYESGKLWPAKFRLLRPIFVGLSKELDQNNERALRRCLRYLGDRLGQNPKQQRFFFGNELSIADISLAASLS